MWVTLEKFFFTVGRSHTLTRWTALVIKRSECPKSPNFHPTPPIYKMVFRFRRRGRALRRRRGGRRPMKRMRRYAAPLVHKIKEASLTSQILATAGASTPGVISFRLNQLQNYLHYQGVWDMFKIVGAKVSFVCKANSAEPTAASAPLPVMYIAPNRDPFTAAPASISDVLNDDGFRVIRADKMIGKSGLYIKCPKPDMSLAIPGGPNVPMNWSYGVSSKTQPWLCTGGGNQAFDQSQVPHYGFRYIVDNSGGAVDVAIQVYVTLYVQFKEQN